MTPPPFLPGRHPLPTMTTTAGVYLLSPEHADTIQRFASDPTLAAMVGVGHPPPGGAGLDAIERIAAERLAGTSYWSAVVDGGELKGVSALLEPYGNEPRITVWIDPAARRRGYGAFALRMILEFTFTNLQLARVHAFGPTEDIAVGRTLSRAGFTATDAFEPSTPNATRHWALTRAEWTEHRDRPALAALHADLRTILEAELAAGNEVAETGRGWPDPDSVFVRLRHPFRTKPTLPDGIAYTEPNDPHWWKADYSSRSPRHTLAY